MSYQQKKTDNSKKVPMSASVDLRDLHNALATVESLTGENLMGMSKSEALDSCLKVLGAIGYKQNLLEETSLPPDLPTAAEKLRQNFALHFDNDRQKRVIQEAQQTSLDIGEESLSLEEVPEEEQTEPTTTIDAEAVLQKIQSIESDGPNPLTGLINIARSSGWEDEDIARKLKPFLEDKEPTSDRIMELQTQFKQQPS